LDTQLGAPRRLLVVDDEPVQCLIVTRAMAAASFDAEAATSLDETAHRFASATFDVIVLDLSLGGREGIILLRQIAAAASDPRGGADVTPG